MGRRRKEPILIEQSGVIPTEVTAVNGLHEFKRFIDVHGDNATKKIITRIFFVSPNQAEINETEVLHRSDGLHLCVIGARTQYIRNPGKSPPLYEYCRNLNFSEEFSIDIVRLFVGYVEGKKYSTGYLNDHVAAIKEFVDFLANQNIEINIFSLSDIDFEIWCKYLSTMEKDARTTSSKIFSKLRTLFSAYPQFCLNGRLKHLIFRECKGSRTKPASEHTSELVNDKVYSDSEMYQLLAIFVESIQRRIGYLKYYQNLTEKDMPDDWLRPGERPIWLCGGHRTNQQELINKWLMDENDGYQILIDHHIMWHKLNPVYTSAYGWNGSFSKKLSLAPNKALTDKFSKTMAQRHGYLAVQGGGSLINAYIKKKSGKHSTPQINQIAWCLANLLMMFTGINKEVALSIPSQAKDGNSILTRSDNTFITSDKESSEIVLYGWKERTGMAPRKMIDIPIPKTSPIYGYLQDYEKYVKVENDGPFFELNRGFSWEDAGAISNFNELYPVLDESGEYLKSIQTPRFRKVFLSGQLIEHLKGVKDGNELAEKLRQDLHQKNFDTTFVYYILKSNTARSVIDIAIATVTSEKLKDALKFKGKILLKPSSKANKKVFLCDCEDPTKPSHGVAIAEECRHYDLCLGCERSIIFKEHLPYICCRILQYEEERKIDPNFGLQRLRISG
jgi:hypothetical protein